MGGSLGRVFDPAEALGRPSGLVLKTDLLIKAQKPLIPVRDIESNAKEELSETHRTEMKRPGIALPEVIGSVHEAPEEDTMLEHEHVGRLVG